MLQDEEIQFAIDSKVDLLAASIMCCETITSRLAKKFDFRLGPSDNKLSQQYEQYNKVLERLKNSRVGLGGPVFFNPNRSIFDIDMMNACNEGHNDPETE
jgi:hypothetical protein